jgi:hypothetical protein
MDANSTISLKHLTQSDLLAFGLNDLAYLKPTVVDGQPVFAIYAADGSQLALAQTREVGLAAMLQHDLEPVSLH